MALCDVSGDAMLIYAYYTDEIDSAQKCNKKDSFQFNRFTKVKRNCAEMFAESACGKGANPLTDSSLPVPETKPAGLKTPSLFDKTREYFIYVSKPFVKKYKTYETEGGSKPKAAITLFFGVGPEISLFGMRAFFENTDNGVLITIPGIEAGWKGYGAAWGVGIKKAMIESLFKRAEIPDAEWEVKIMAAYSTGYRGFNGTVVNAGPLGIDLAKVERAIFFDCLYFADDHVANNKEPAYSKRYTQRAVDTLIKANGQVSIAVYKVTLPGTPPGRYANQLRVDIPSGNLELVDLLHKSRFDHLRALFLARFIQNAETSGIVKPKDLPAPLVEFIKLLPARGTLVTGQPGPDEENLDDFLKRNDVLRRIREIYTLRHGRQRIIQHMVNLSINHGLLGGWESGDHHDMMHRYFVQELGKQHLI